MKKVSVIIPCYNQSQYLAEAVLSVLNSTYKNIEIIVVNDGSSDISTEDLRDLVPAGVTIINQENLGVCTARNNGIKSSSGEYILTLDADDKIAPTYIEMAVNILDNNPQTGIAYCEHEFFGVKSRQHKIAFATMINMLIQNRIFSAAIFRRNLFDKVNGYKTDMEKGCEDWDFWLSIMETGADVYKIPEVLFFWRKSENERTQKALKPLNYLKIRLSIIKHHRKLYSKYALIVYPVMFAMVVKNLLSHFYKSLKGGNK